MADVFTPAKRSAIMARIKGKNTKPELIVRKLVHSLGYRFRLHQDTILGKPDLVLPRHKKIIFVHGCFWHGHAGCSRASLPATNIEFWRKKLLANRNRDTSVKGKLYRDGWQVFIIWQCQTKNIETLSKRLQCFLRK
ncbi:MAG TPA: very short patch repair endonuclease [Pyrinomonadaceae bacterium]|nr:very short patch repair endonuclease [Pyrinomonadaceae bacterium]